MRAFITRSAEKSLKKLFQGKSWGVPEVSDVKVAYRVFRFPQFHYLTMCFYGLLCRDIQLVAKIFMARSVGGCDFSVQRRHSA